MSKLMQNILIIFGILIIGVVMGWNWHKSTIKPIIIQKPGQNIVVTEWKTNTITVKDTIEKTVVKIQYQDKPIYVYSVLDSIINNTYVYNNILTQNGIDTKDIIKFSVQSKDYINVYADSTFNESYLIHKQQIRIKDFYYKPAPIQIPPKQIISKFQCYGNAGVLTRKTETINDNIINKGYEFIPMIGVSVIIAQRYKFDIGAKLDGLYFGVGVKFLEWK